MTVTSASPKYNLANRATRQKDIIDTEKLSQCRATIVGVGAIGRQLALQLTSMGVPHLQLVDFDTVEAVNLSCQGYLEGDLGRFKVDATAEACIKLNSQISIDPVCKSFYSNLSKIGNLVFVCVDTLRARSYIWAELKAKGIARLFVDGRMAAESFRVLTVCDTASMGAYEKTLYPQAEMYDAPCTAKSTIYCANIAAGIMVARVSKFLRGLPIEGDVMYNLMTDEIIVSKGALISWYDNDLGKGDSVD